MARQRISLIPDEQLKEITLRQQIGTGEMTPEIFAQLDPDEKRQVDGILFKMASEKVEPNQGISVLEFVVFGFIRIMTKKISGIGLSEDEMEIEKGLQAIMKIHEVTNDSVPRKDWLFDYMQYAEAKAIEILNNRREHIERKKQTIGQV